MQAKEEESCEFNFCKADSAVCRELFYRGNRRSNWLSISDSVD